MKPPITIATLLVAFFVSLAMGQAPVDPELLRLRQEFGARFLEPAPHMELAKYFRSKGNDSEAFYVLEAARRYRFDQETFDAAFLLHFGGFAPLDNSPAEETKYLQLRKASPTDAKIAKHLADIYISRGDYKSGEPLLRFAYEADKGDYRTLLALEELYRRLETPEKSEKLIVEFQSKHRDSVGGYYFRLRSLPEASPDAKALLTEALTKYPDEGHFWFLRGREAIQRKDLDDAERSFVKATILDKNGAVYHAAAAGFYRVERKDLPKAIRYYLNVYFLNPHAHFDGHAEAKVSGLNADVASQFVQSEIAAGKDPQQMLDHPNPAVVGVAMDQLVKDWKSSNTDAFIELLGHDDSLVRWVAMLSLMEKEGRKLDPKLKGLLASSDTRVRGLSAYMAVKLWKQESFPEIRKLLASDAQLLRFDAVSALMLHGGPEGRKLVIEHRRSEKNAYLNRMIDASLSADTPR